MEKEKRSVIRICLIQIKYILFIIAVWTLADLYGEFLWFKMLDYSSVFWTVFLTKWGLGILFGMAFLLFAGTHCYLARKTRRQNTPWEFSYRTQDLNNVKVIPVKPGHVNIFIILICLILGVVMGIWPALAKWDVFLRFIYKVPFSYTDPVFGKDIGFFIFSYPVYVFVQKWLFYSFLIITLLVGFIYLKDKAMNLKINKLKFSRRAKVHLSLLIGIVLLLIAWNSRLKSFDLLYSTRGVVFGAGYTDMHAQLIAYWIIIVIASICAFIFWINSPSKGWRWPLIGLGTFIVLSVLVSMLCPWAVQRFIVEPNELSLEKPYILNNIKYTRFGYNLDQIKEKDFHASVNLTLEDVQNNSPTVKNLKLWDKNTLRQTYSELQEMRLYYSFAGVDEDRYTFNAEKTQIMLSIRELDQSKLPSQAQTFENRYFKYTHGYGLCMSPVNNVTEKGLPNLIIKDIPPDSQTMLSISRPEIYYGERTNRFVIVNSRSQEFDYPKGDINVYSRYQGRGGVPIGPYINRLVFSIKFIEPRILLTRYIAPGSRIMFNRQIMDRVKILAPFLTYDRDPYAAVSETGRIFWILDAYTTTDKYPYSDRTTLFSDSIPSLRARPLSPAGRQVRPKRINYIRNSVKAIIDAYNGTVTFYIVDKTDPIIQTYKRIFPRLFKSFSDMPDDLRGHIRYPRDMFEIQAKMYLTYHMKDAQVFYNKEDLWDMPVQKGISRQTRTTMKGYYIIMRLPEQAKEEFLLMVPFTPDNKSNMIAFMYAQCDGPDYGKLSVYKLSKDKLIYGPRQIEARIDQQTEISTVLTLWTQQGSDVFRGDLLVIPIEESILYIEPVYLMATDKSTLPELKRVIVAYGERIEMAETLSNALQKIFRKVVAEPSSVYLTEGFDNVDNGRPDRESIIDLARMITRYYLAAQESIRKGNWIEYGQYQEQLQKAIFDMSVALGE